MADEPAATATTELADQPTLVNGFDRLAAVTTTPAPTTAAAAPPIQPPMSFPP
jgi:hypothetical protein